MKLQKKCDPIAYVVILKSVHDNVSLTLRFFCVPLPTQFQSLFSLTQRPRLDLNKNNNWTSKKQLHISFDLATFNKQNMCHKMTSLEGFITALDFIQNQHTKYVKKKKG